MFSYKKLLAFMLTVCVLLSHITIPIKAVAEGQVNANKFIENILSQDYGFNTGISNRLSDRYRIAFSSNEKGLTESLVIDYFFKEDGAKSFYTVRQKDIKKDESEEVKIGNSDVLIYHNKHDHGKFISYNYAIGKVGNVIITLGNPWYANHTDNKKMFETIYTKVLSEVNNFLESYPVSNQSDKPKDKEEGNEKDTETSVAIKIENSYKGLVVDGSNKLKLNITGFINGHTLVFDNLKSGKIVNEKGKEVKKISSIEEAKEIYYLPDNSLDTGKLKTKKSISRHKGSSQDTNLWFALEEIHVKELDNSSKLVKSFNLKLELYRPSIILVHGFTGDKSTWKKLNSTLREDKYDTVNENYYYSDKSGQSIPSQSKVLSSIIKGVVSNLEKSKIKASRVDVVAHSMGGLITRYYISKNIDYKNEVRKLIMVGTPNHGCSFTDGVVGYLSSKALNKHKEAAKQLYGKSKFILELNKGEHLGEHLNQNTQYGLIYGTGMGMYFEGDIVVSELSAHLQGVTANGYKGLVHSEVFSSFGEALTINKAVFNNILEWLKSDIPVGSYSKTEIKPYSFEGDSILLDDIDSDSGQIDILDDRANSVSCFQTITTGEKSYLGLVLSSGGQKFGYVDINENTKLNFNYVSPNRVEVYIYYGSARFITKSGKEKHFTVVAGNGGDVKAVTGLQTDFIVSANKNIINTQVLEGSARITTAKNINNVKNETVENQAVTVGNNSINNRPDFSNVWWNSSLYKKGLFSLQGLKDKVIEAVKYLASFLPEIPDRSDKSFYKVVAIHVVVDFLAFFIVILVLKNLIKLLLYPVKKIFRG